MRVEVRTLEAEIQKHLSVLKRLEDYLVRFSREKLDGNTPCVDSAMILAQALTNYYTCLETVFLRISRFFENNLPAERWHQSLLEKMTLQIDEVRPRVLRDDVYWGLLELLKFRHFARYYFEMDYDWQKLMYLVEKFHTVREPVREDIENFVRFLVQL